MKDETGRYRSKTLASPGTAPKVRLALIGAPKVGKSAISVRFLTKRFIHEYQRNVENTYRRHLQFGNEVIEYALRDFGILKDSVSLLEWSTCIGVIYSVTDSESFKIATSLLDEIHTQLHTKNNTAPTCLALIGNKRDLNHLREVSSKDGKQSAKQYGAGFWEVSASEDYHSTYAPLNSLIVESYLSVMTGLTTSRSSCTSAPGSIHEDIKSRDFFTFDSIDSDCEDEFTSPTTNWPLEKRKIRNHFSDRKKMELQFEEPRRIKKVSVGKLSLDNFLLTETMTTNNGLNPCEEKNENLLCEEPIRSSSWSRKEKKRSSIRKSSDKKEGISKNSSNKNSSSLKKSQSYTDLKSWEKEQATDEPELKNESRVQKLAKEIDTNNGYRERTGVDASFATPTALLSPDIASSTSSFSKLSSYNTTEPAKSPRLSNERRKTTQLVTLNEISDSDSLSPRTPETERGPTKFKRTEKKSVRRKISSIFRGPKIIVES